ncbi:MAG: squalene/phytoene synthase family protein [Caldilineaceae bacterium]|nr:squalene/phytoene synthase family protein [Caldilineaceae bacterium]
MDNTLTKPLYHVILQNSCSLDYFLTQIEEKLAMQGQSHAWERTLLSLAHEAHHTEPTPHALHVDAVTLRRAYDYCETLIAIHSKSFLLASALLPIEKRRAVRALYAFCRVTDDIVDRGQGDVQANLAHWRRRILVSHPPQDDLVAIAWAAARLRYQVPVRYAEQLIEGVARDLTQCRYQTFAELTAYCYGVASTVGLMSMHVIGYAGTHALPYAIKLGVALQLTNILRDVGEDWRAGRLYLPQEDLAHFGLSEADIARGQVTSAWRAFMRYQVGRTRLLYREAAPGIALLDRDGRFAIAAAADLYQGILADIEAHDYDVFTRRAFVTKWGKVRRLPGIWWRSRTG